MSQFCQSEQIVEGLHRINVPLPHNALKQINTYLILGGNRPVLVDTGFNRPECIQALSMALAELGLGFGDIDILLTHLHPDHINAIEGIWREGMAIYAHALSFSESRTMDALWNGIIQCDGDSDYCAGIGASDLAGLSFDLCPLQKEYPVTYLRDGQTFECGRLSFEVIATPGHDRTHICLYEPAEKIMITGDHVLPRITPNVSSFSLSSTDLRDYLESLDKVRAYDVALALPSHGEMIADLSGRVDELKRHYHNRVEEMEGLVRAGHHGLVSIASHASWGHADWFSWDFGQQLLSLSETMAHLAFAIDRGDLCVTSDGATKRLACTK